MSEDRKKKDHFIQEQIRKKPLYKQKGFQKAINRIGTAVVIGASAGLIFAIVHPFALKYFMEPAKMTVVGDEGESERERERDVTENSTDVTIFSEAETECPAETVTIIEKKELSLTDYEQLYKELVDVTEEIKASIVTVTGLRSEVDLFNDVDESSTKAAGVIIGEKQDTFLILTENRILQSAEEIKITFYDGTIADAKIQQRDEITDLAVLNVSVEDLEKETAENVNPAVFGTSRTVSAGEPIIAMGVDYLSLGMVTSRPDLDICDGSYRQIKTDIIGKMENGGVLLNLKGQVVGILGPNSEFSDSPMTLNGVGISEIQYLVDGMSNDRAFAHFGVTGKEVTDSLAKEFTMPKGVLVTNVEESSPAMKKGIQCTDIISSMDGHKIENMRDYMEVIRSCDPGDTIPVCFYRKVVNGYQETTIDVTLSER